MTLSTTVQASPLAGRIITQTSAIATADTNVTGAAGSVLHLVDVDNTGNVAATYLKLFNAAAPTVGTTAPDMIFMVPASVRRVFPIMEGVTFSVAISLCAVTAGGTAGTTSPTNPVVVRLATS